MAYYRDTQFDRVLLEQEQNDLLEVLVEAARRVPRDRRQKFMVTAELGSHLSEIVHEGLPSDFEGAYDGDLEALANEQMLVRTGTSDTPLYDVTPRGFKYYEHLQLNKGSMLQRPEAVSRSWIASDAFLRRYPDAARKWLEAEALVWSGDSVVSLTTIGHLCLEAIQDVFDELVTRYGVTGVAEKAKTIARLRAIVAKAAASETTAAVVESLIGMVGALNDLVQRQEHGAFREQQSLLWEDGRRVAFLTLVVLSEVDRLLGAGPAS
jgi:hypothetical protein